MSESWCRPWLYLTIRQRLFTVNLLQLMTLSGLNRQRHCHTACYGLPRVSVTIASFETASRWLYCTFCWHLINNGCPCSCGCNGFKRHSHQQPPQRAAV